MSLRKYKIGEIVDVDFDNDVAEKFFSDHEKEVRNNRRVWVKGVGEVVDEFGVVSRLNLFHNNKELDVHSKYMRLNKKQHREKRLKNLLD